MTVESTSPTRSLSRKIRSFVVVISKVAKEFIEFIEAILVAILIMLTLMALVMTIRDITSIELGSPLTEFQVLVSDVLVLVVLIELTRSFIISSLGGERYLEGFIEMGIIILIRELALAAMAANMINALIASAGATLLILALWFTKEKRRKSEAQE